MTPGRRPRYGARAGQSVAAVTFGRAQWRELTRQLRDAAGAVLAGRSPDPHADFILKAALKRTGSAPLPVEGASAVPIRAALIAAAEAFTLAAGERRSLLAGLVTAAADVVDQLLTEEGHALADRTWKRHLKED